MGPLELPSLELKAGAKGGQGCQKLVGSITDKPAQIQDGILDAPRHVVVRDDELEQLAVAVHLRADRQVTLGHPSGHLGQM